MLPLNRREEVSEAVGTPAGRVSAAVGEAEGSRVQRASGEGRPSGEHGPRGGGTGPAPRRQVPRPRPRTCRWGAHGGGRLREACGSRRKRGCHGREEPLTTTEQNWAPARPRGQDSRAAAEPLPLHTRPAWREPPLRLPRRHQFPSLRGKEPSSFASR